MRNHSRFRISPEDRPLLWSGLIQLGSAAALVNLEFRGTDLEIMGFGSPCLDRSVSFVVLTVLMYFGVLFLTMLVHTFTSMVVLRQTQDQSFKSFKYVATTAFILLLVWSLAHRTKHRHSAEPTSDRSGVLD